MKNLKSLFPVYVLAILGDLNLSMLQVLNVLYGVILGAAPWQNGFIAGGYGLSYLVMAAILGHLGDKMPRKHSMILALCGQIAIAAYFFLIANTVFLLILGQLILGCAYGFFWPAIEAHISENTEHSEVSHQKAISNFCISWSIGFTVGPFLAGLFSDYNIKMGYLFVLVLYLINILIVLILIPSKKVNNFSNSNSDLPTDGINNSSNTKWDIYLIRILFGMFIYAMIGRIVLSYFADYASRPSGLNLTGTSVGIMLFSFGIGRTGYFILSRYIESSLKRLIYSYLIMAIFLTLISFINNYNALFIIILTFGIFSGLIYKSSLELLMIYEKEQKGAKAGLFESMVGMGSASSPIIAGFLAEISLILPFFIYAIIAFFMFCLNLYLEKKSD